MKKYTIPEQNLRPMENELRILEKKISKYGGHFDYHVVGQHFEDVLVEDEMKKVLFFDVEVEGELKINGWKYCASVEKTEKGNIIVAKDGGDEIPEIYYHSEPKCDHCHSNRYRRYTYVIKNEDTGEYRQVGKACLEDYTKGMSANTIAQIAEFFKNLDRMTISRDNMIYYLKTKDVIMKFQEYLKNGNYRYIYEMPKNYDGHYKVSIGKNGNYEFQNCLTSWTPKKTKGGRGMLDFYSKYYAKKITVFCTHEQEFEEIFEEVKDWYASQNDDRGQDFHNYKTLFSQDMIPEEDVGILCNGFLYYTGTVRYNIIKDKTDKIRTEYFIERNKKTQQKFNANSEDYTGKYVNLYLKPISYKDDYYNSLIAVDKDNNLYYMKNELISDGEYRKYKVEKFEEINVNYCHGYITGDVPLMAKANWLVPVFRNMKKISFNTNKDSNCLLKEVYDSLEELEDARSEAEKVRDVTEHPLEEYVGNIGDEIEVTLITGLQKTAKSPKGAYLYEGYDDKGHRFGIWTRKDISTDKSVKVKATVWKHNSYYTKKSTILSLPRENKGDA